MKSVLSPWSFVCGQPSVTGKAAWEEDELIGDE
jgi:hypothetical protein